MDAYPRVVRTAHLTLRPLQADDAARLHRIYQTEGVLRYFPNPLPPSLEKVERYILLQQAHWAAHGYGNWGILLEGGREIIGWAGLQYVQELDETEVGFLLDRPYWGKGYATEAAMASLYQGFERLNLDHIIALVHGDNSASRRVIEKCSMGYTETVALWGMELLHYHIDKTAYLKANPLTVIP